MTPRNRRNRQQVWPTHRDKALQKRDAKRRREPITRHQWHQHEGNDQ